MVPSFPPFDHDRAHAWRDSRPRVLLYGRASSTTMRPACRVATRSIIRWFPEPVQGPPCSANPATKGPSISTSISSRTAPTGGRCSATRRTNNVVMPASIVLAETPSADRVRTREPEETAEETSGPQITWQETLRPAKVFASRTCRSMERLYGQ
jgi:hypothetical protein